MKYIKRIASLLLALVMVLAVTTTAFAAGDGAITVDNPKAGTTYTAYKIFDVTYNEGKTAYSYTIDSISEWLDTVKAFADTADNGLTLEQVTGSTTYIVTTTEQFSAPAFANALKAAVSGKTGIALTVTDGKASATGLDLGYYFVSSSTGALCNLTTTTPTVTIHDKNDIPFEKVDDKESVDVGEVVTYTITGKVPDATGFTAYTYQFDDTMSSGLTFNKDVTVTIGGQKINDAKITYDVGGNANSFTVVIPVLNYQNQIGAEIKVSYTATVNENAVAKIEKNHATLTYSNDPTNKESKTKTPPDEETVYSAKLVIDKYKAGSEETKLAGAQFVLYKEGAEKVKLYYKWNETTKKVEWVADKAQATVKTTDKQGAASFDGLADGTYYLEEIAAPAGYNMLKEPVTVDVKGSDTVVGSLTVTEKVSNQSGTELPSTGGMGTTLFYVLGGVLVAAAVVLLVTKKRMHTNG